MQRTLDAADRVVIDLSEVAARRPRFLGRFDARLDATADRLFQRSHGAIDERSAVILEQLAGELRGYVGSDVAVAATITRLADDIDQLLSGGGEVSFSAVARRIRAAQRQASRHSMGRGRLHAEFRALGRMLKRADTELKPSATPARSASSGRRRAISDAFDVVNRLQRSLSIASHAPPTFI